MDGGLVKDVFKGATKGVKGVSKGVTKVATSTTKGVTKGSFVRYFRFGIH